MINIWAENWKKHVSYVSLVTCTLSMLLPANPLSSTCLTMSRCKLLAACWVALYTHTVLKSTPQPHCPLFCMEKLDQIHKFGQTKCWHCSSLIFELHSMQNIIMWYLIQNALFGWVNNWTVCRAYYLPAIIEKALVSENAGLYWSKVDFMLVAWPKRRGIQIPRNWPSCLQAKRPDGCIGWQPGMVSGSHLMAVMRISQSLAHLLPDAGKCNRPLNTHQSHKAYYTWSF